MKTKLILIEGIPGSGKSTIAKKTAAFYRDAGVKVNLYNEGDYHPADLAWNAVIPVESLEGILQKYSAFRGEIDSKTHLEGDYAIISYTQVKTEDRTFYQEMANYEVYDGRVPFETFCRLHMKRWRSFGRQAREKEELTVFECAFLQNHMSVLMGYQLAGLEEMKAHFLTLIQTVEDLNPLLIYLTQPDIRETIERVAKERVSPNGNWVDGMIHYYENTPYGKLHGCKGLDGAIKTFEESKRMQLEVIGSLPISALILDNPDFDWEKLWDTLKEKLPL